MEESQYRREREEQARQAAHHSKAPTYSHTYTAPHACWPRRPSYQGSDATKDEKQFEIRCCDESFDQGSVQLGELQQIQCQALQSVESPQQSAQPKDAAARCSNIDLKTFGKEKILE